MENNNIFELERKSLGEELANKIKEAMLNSDIVKGEWLKEEDIANKYKISRTPVREAFTILEKEGLISSVPYKGRIVIGIDEKTVRDSYFLRANLERLVVETVCLELDSEDFLKLEKIIDMLETSSTRQLRDQSKEYNWQFHWMLINKCDIDKLKVWLHQLYDQFPKVIRYPSRGLEPVNEYKEILYYLRNKECIKAGELMYNHILKGGEEAAKAFNIQYNQKEEI